MPDEVAVDSHGVAVIETAVPQTVEIFTEPVGTIYVDVPDVPTSVVEVFTQPVVELGIVTPGPRGVRGEEGPQGPAGIPTRGATTTYVFPVPVYVWEGEHQYDGYPTVFLLEPDGTKFLGKIQYPQPGLVVASFMVPMAGTLVIRA